MGTRNETLALSVIQFDQQLQMRASVSEAVIEEYAGVWREAGEENPFPRILVYYDGTYYWLADGHYRCESARLAGRKQIDAVVKDGDKRDAILAAMGANESHGVRRTHEDKRKAVSSALLDEELRVKSDGYLAQLCRVSTRMVAELRKEMERADLIPVVQEREGRDGRVRKSQQQRQIAAVEEPQRRISDVAEVAVVEPDPEEAAQEWYDFEPPVEPVVSHEGNGHAGNGKPKESDGDDAKEAMKGYKKLIKHLNRMGMLEHHDKCLRAIKASIEG